MDPCEISRLGQDSEQVAQKDAQTGGPFVHGPGVRAAFGLIHTRKLSLRARCDKIGSEARGLMNSLLHRGLHTTTGALPRGYRDSGGHQGCPSDMGDELGGVVRDAQGGTASERPRVLGYARSAGHRWRRRAITGRVALQQSRSFPHHQKRCCYGLHSAGSFQLVDGDRMVVKVLGFSAAGGEQKEANVLIWTRPGSAPLEGDVLRAGRSSLSGLHRGTMTGLTREVAKFDLWPWGHQHHGG